MISEKNLRERPVGKVDICRSESAATEDANNGLARISPIASSNGQTDFQ